MHLWRRRCQGAELCKGAGKLLPEAGFLRVAGNGCSHSHAGCCGSRIQCSSGRQHQGVRHMGPITKIACSEIHACCDWVDKTTS